MAIIRVQVRLPAVSGIPRDTAVHDFVFSNPSAALITNLIAFYNSTPAGGSSFIARYLAPSVSRVTSQAVMNQYDITAHLAGSAAGPPIVSSTFTPGAATSAISMPGAVAVCLDMHSAFGTVPEWSGGSGRQHKGGTRPRGRLRGRLFFGPLNQAAMTSDTSNGVSQPITALVTDLSLAAKALLVAEPTWSVWSRRNAAVTPIVGGYVAKQWTRIAKRDEENRILTAWP